MDLPEPLVQKVISGGLLLFTSDRARSPVRVNNSNRPPFYYMNHWFNPDIFGAVKALSY